MATPREMLSDPRYETVRVKAVLIPLLVRFELPSEAKEQMPLTEVRDLDGTRILRFYAIPQRGDTVQFRDHLWRVIGLHHEVLPRGSKRVDKMPIVITEHVGPIEVG